MLSATAYLSTQGELCLGGQRRSLTGWLVANEVFWGRQKWWGDPAPKPRVNMPKECGLPPLRCPIPPLFRGCSPPSGTERVRPPKDTSLLGDQALLQTPEPGPTRWGHQTPVVHDLALSLDLEAPSRLAQLPVAVVFFGVALTTDTVLLVSSFFQVLHLPYIVDLLADQRIGARSHGASACFPC